MRRLRDRAKQDDIGADSERTGEFGPGRTFSALYVECLELGFTGELRIWDEASASEATVSFVRGRPCAAGGEALPRDKVGEVLTSMGLLDTGTLDGALATQAKLPRAERRRIGAMLEGVGLKASAITVALALQTKARVARLFGLTEGIWRLLPGTEPEDDAPIDGAPIDGLAVLVPALREHAPADELRGVSDDLLGRAVSVEGELDGLSAKLALDDEDSETLGLLDKPRKVEQFERAAPSRSHARAVLRALELLGRLERHPASAGVPLAKPTRATGRPAAGARPRPRTAGVAPRPPAPRAPSPPRPTAAAAAPSGEASALEAEIRAMAASLEGKDYFAALGLTREASASKIRTAYMDRLRKVHPDRLAQGGLTAELRRQAEEVSARLNEIYQVLNDDGRRAEYLALLRDPRVGGDPSKKTRLDAAERKFQMAQVHLRKKDYDQARELLTEASDAVPNDGRFKAYLAWALWQDPSLLQSVIAPRVVELLDKAVEEATDDADAHYFYGVVLRVTGDTTKAAKMFKRCIQLRPHHHEAIRELRLFRMRSEKK